jgi:hypothetical protein
MRKIMGLDWRLRSTGWKITFGIVIGIIAVILAIIALGVITVETGR